MKNASFSEAEAFLALADHQGFGVAAREIGVTQSTMSRRIAALEERIGQRLVERTTRRVALTEAGISYAAELRDVLHRLEAAEARVQNRTTEPEGLLRVTMPTAFGRACVIPHLTQLIRRYPKLCFELDLSDRYVDLLHGDFDVAIRLAAPVQSGIDMQRIGCSKVHLCASPNYLKVHRLVKDPREIARYDCLALRTYAPRISWKLKWKGRALSLEVSPRLVVTDVIAMHRLVLNGIGVAMLPSYLVNADIAAGRLVDVMPDLELSDLEIFVAYPHGREALAKVAVFLKEMKCIPFLTLHDREAAMGRAPKIPKRHKLPLASRPRLAPR